jgi:hypothetical protein
VFEDSTLHPDFSFLVWLMVAESKVRFPSFWCIFPNNFHLTFYVDQTGIFPTDAVAETSISDCL